MGRFSGKKKDEEMEDESQLRNGRATMKREVSSRWKYDHKKHSYIYKMLCYFYF